MQIKPFGTRITFRRIPWKAKTESGLLYIPESRHDINNEAIVLDIGPKVARVEAGDKVVLPRYALGDLYCPGETEQDRGLQTCDEKDVYAVWRENKLSPIDSKVILRRCAPRKVSAGGILLVEELMPDSVEGVVVAAGPQADEIGIGDHVVFSALMAYCVIWLNEEEFLLVCESDIWGKVVADEEEDKTP